MTPVAPRNHWPIRSGFGTATAIHQARLRLSQKIAGRAVADIAPVTLANRVRESAAGVPQSTLAQAASRRSTEPPSRRLRR